MSTLARYLVFQLPAWGIASGIALGLDTWTAIPGTWIGLALAAYVVKDFALFPYVRSAYESAAHEPGSELMGARGVVVVPLDPEGWVEIRHERWRARAQEPAETVEVGAHVQVRGLRGSVVLVDREE